MTSEPDLQLVPIPIRKRLSIPCYPPLPNPAWDWLIEGCILRGVVSMTAAPGGTGKSLFSLQLGVAISAGLNWGGLQIDKGLKVLLLNKEDPLVTISMRLNAIKIKMGLPDESLANLHWIPEAKKLTLIEKREGSIYATPALGDIGQEIRDLGIDLLIIDPWIYANRGLDENSASDMGPALEILSEFAEKHNIHVLIIHHTSKSMGGIGGDQDAARGSGSQMAGTRGGFSITVMSETECRDYGVAKEERFSYIKLMLTKNTNGKMHNYETWFLKNGVDVLCIDKAGVEVRCEGVALIEWDPPRQLTPVSAEMRADLVHIINRGRFEGKVYRSWHYDKNNKYWAGNLFNGNLVGVEGCEGAMKIMGGDGSIGENHKVINQASIQAVLTDMEGRGVIVKGVDKCKSERGGKNNYWGYEMRVSTGEQLKFI